MEFRRIGETVSARPEGTNIRREFLALLNTDYKSGALQEREFVGYQTEIASILAGLIRLYTSGDSSSVKDETAAQILGSIYYAMDAYTAHMDNTGGLLYEIRKNGVHQIYSEGVKIIRTCFDETKKLLGDITLNKLAVPLAPYNEQLDSAIPEFLRTYDIEFHAQDTSCSMDYPLAFDDMSISGIFYIRQYLEKLQIETEFCKLLHQSDILGTLYDYAAKFDMDITNAPVNLFEILFDQLMFTVLSGNEKMDLTITSFEFQQMTKDLSRMEYPKIMGRINDSLRKIIAAFRIENPDLLIYMLRYQWQFAQRVVRASEHGNILNMVLVKGENLQTDKNLFTGGARMNDLEFTRITELVAECDRTEEKIKLISGNIHSVNDYIDLLEADCLYGDEFETLYGSLGDTELAVLGRIIFSGELRLSRLHFTSSLFSRYKKSLEPDWQKHFVDFLPSINENRRSHIEQLINDLVIKEDL